MKQIVWVILGWFTLLTTAQADQPATDEARQKAHIVSRLYQATYGAQEQCSSHKDVAANLDKTIDQFRRAYPELMRLVESSPYLPQAKEGFKAIWNGSRMSPQECRETANILRQFLDAPNGQQEANRMIQILGGSSQLPPTTQDSRQLADDTEKSGKLPEPNDARPRKLPLLVPFEAQKAGSIFTAELRVMEHRSYEFALLLKAKKGISIEEAKRLIKLAGDFGRDKNGKLIRPGISLPLKLRVSAIESSGERVVYDKEIHEEEALGAGGMGIEKLIDVIDLRPGRYKVSIQSLKDIPELAETPITFGIYGWHNTNPID